MSAAYEHLSWPRVMAALHGRLASEAARQRLHAREEPTTLPSDPAVVGARYDEVEGLAIANELGGTEWVTALRDVVDVAPTLAEAARGSVLDPPTLASIRDLTRAIVTASKLRGALGGASAESAAVAETIATRLAGLADCDRLHASLDRSLAVAPDGEIGLADDASPGLARARQQLREARGRLAKQADAMVKRADLSEALADKYWTERQGRVVVPVLASKLAGSPAHAGIIHGSSGSGQTLFVEPPQLVEDNNRLRRAQLAERAEVRRVLEALSRDIGRQADALSASLDTLVELDETLARLRLGEDLGGRRPRVVEPLRGATLRLPTMRHPLMALAGTDVVPNDMELRVGSTMIISGPNAGGKTVALKTVGLCVLLARAGVPIPTGPEAVVPLFRHLVTDVGDDQSIEKDLSTFSAHLGHVHDALRQAQSDGDGTLVLLDEVAAGTEPQQGAALAEAILVTLAERGATGIVTTHFDRLKMLAVDRQDHFVNAAVGFDLQALRPTFELTIGTPGSSSAIALARRLGLPSQVLDAAEAILGRAERDTDALLRQLEGERTRILQTQQKLAAAEAELARERARLSAREAGELEGAKVRHAKAKRAAAASLHALEDEITRQRKKLRAATEPASVPGQAAPAVADARALAKKARAEIAAETTPAEVAVDDEQPGAIAVGDRVHVPGLGADGQVLSVQGRKAVVQLPTAKMTVALADLVRRKAKPRPRASANAGSGRPGASAAAAFFGADAKAFDPSFDDVVDVRGQRVDEATTAVEVFLDRSIAADREVVVIRHGHGSGALRKVVREHLDRLGHVVTHRSGHSREGGDGVTVVWVKA